MERTGAGGLLERARRFVEEDVWVWEPQPRTWRAWAVRPLQLSVLIGEGFLRDQLLLRASALTYVTLLSLIPLLALAFSIVGAIGISDDLVNLVVEQVAAGSPEAQARIVDIVQGVKFGQLGTIGAAALLVTTVLAIGNVEKALNGIWGVREKRDMVRSFTDYLAVMVTAPLLLATAISAAAAFRSQTVVQRLLEFEALSTLYKVGLTVAPTLVTAVAFTFLYRFLPNTHVRLTSAALGGIVAAVLFSLAQQAYIGLNLGAARYNALVGGAAWLPLLFVWIYFSWAIVLIGAEMAFAHQNLEHYRREVVGTPPGPAAREAIGLQIALELARAFRDGDRVWTSDGLARALDVPVRTVRELCRDLADVGIAAPYGGEQGEYQLGRAAERITVNHVIGALRGPRRDDSTQHVGEVAWEVLGQLDEGARKAAGELSLADLLERVPHAPA